ncbi:GNAT family N-acetyltransferase [Cytobacillus firmus]|uniref:GNAT family N-acetyltransferase n=1 Tax=Cytobacillus firmus TaxID=1399 RepID=UPI00158033A6|nr:GNAT family N-acetyltransferase [Cytobacillus firmus]MBG9549027.1 spermidine acetyltransferase [Cytobacillus firmus]MBG9602180.1 spermidine acetyltransferase [Cytobacillus firmus]MED1941464.1 GNAT family N-acetyltransferase [Cytobacillus firmus]NUH85339.1 GNAT family N-acetyltransferase [Cytobacillus firmus]
MNTGKVKIEEVTADNWFDCCLLELSEEQRAYMEPNAVSIAQSKFETALRPYVIYLEDKAVGFLMFNTCLEEMDAYWIYRIMVDKEHQGRGIGKKATELMIAEMAKLPNAKKLAVGYHLENLGAHHLYASLGFADHGQRFGKEMAVVKDLD